MRKIILPLALAAGAIYALNGAGMAQTERQWPAYGGTNANDNFSPLKQITPANVGKLINAWTYHYGGGTDELGDRGLDYRFEVQPLLIKGVLYISTPGNPRMPDLKSTVTALVPETGAVLWKWESPRNIHGRGLAYWPGDGKTGPRLFFGTDKGYLMAVDVKTGQTATGFGENGAVDAYAGVASPRVGESRRSTWTIPNPVSIYKNLVITSARPGEVGPPGPRGDLRAWDARTGRLVWSFHTIPQPGEPHYEEYKPEEALDRSGGNVWSTMTIDDKRGILYAPLGDINGTASGRDLYTDSLVALDAATGKLKWFQQITHHDVWDWDLPTPAVLITVHKDGKAIPAVAQTGKHGLLFIFNRLTGAPIFGMEERPTPRSDDPNDDVWPTQPFPLKPGPLGRVSMTKADIPNITPEQYQYCTDFWDKNNIVSPGLYARPLTTHGIVTMPGSTGGPNWGGPSYNPKTGIFVVNQQAPAVYRGPGLASLGRGGFGRGRGPAPEGGRGAGPQGPAPSAASDGPPQVGFQYRVNDQLTIPCGPIPYGQLVAVDTNTAEILWRVPLGNFEPLGDKGIGLGTKNLGGNIQTASGLVFIAAANDRRLRAFDVKTGKELWAGELEASGHATPITYMGKDGKQYVVIAAGGGTTAGTKHMADALMAFRLP